MSSSAETNRKILDAAWLCADKSPDFSMADVAQAAGLSRQAVYLHFPRRADLLYALMIRIGEDQVTAAIETAPSARAALTILVTRMAELHPKAWPVMRASSPDVMDDRLRDATYTLAERFRAEGALAPYLSLQAAGDLLAALLSLSVWKELVVNFNWDSARYKSHIAFLAAAAVTR